MFISHSTSNKSLADALQAARVGALAESGASPSRAGYDLSIAMRDGDNGTDDRLRRTVWAAG